MGSGKDTHTHKHTSKRTWDTPSSIGFEDDTIAANGNHLLKRLRVKMVQRPAYQQQYALNMLKKALTIWMLFCPSFEAIVYGSHQFSFEGHKKIGFHNSLSQQKVQKNDDEKRDACHWDLGCSIEMECILMVSKMHFQWDWNGESGMGDICEHLQIKNLFIFPLTLCLHTATQIFVHFTHFCACHHTAIIRALCA